MLKVGYMSTANIQKIVSRYKTYYGSEVSVFVFVSSDPRLMEAKFKSVFKEQHMELEFYDSTHLIHYIRWATTYANADPICADGRIKRKRNLENDLPEPLSKPLPEALPETCPMLLWLDKFIKHEEFATTADFTAKTLVKHYNGYCVDHDMDVISALSFGKIFKNRIDLNACDIVKRRSNGHSVYRIHKHRVSQWLQNNLAEPAISLATIVLIDFQ
jgi:hypothetical protein